MSNKRIIKKLAIEVAKRDIESLQNYVADKSFGDAFKALDGFNLDVDVSLVGKEFLSAGMRFDCNYKSICATVFDDGNGMCEVYADACEVYVDGETTPIYVAL